MIKKIAIALVLVVTATVGVGFVLPGSWSVERSVVIRGGPERIYPLLFDLRRWQDWSVWTKQMDPLVRHAYEGPQDGVGAKWIWLGPKMGRGKLEITAASPTEGIELAQSIEADAPNSKASLKFSREGEDTRVTWRDEGTMPPVVGGFFKGTVEEQLGAYMTSSLAKLKTTVEAMPEPVKPAPPPVVVPDAGVDSTDAG